MDNLMKNKKESELQYIWRLASAKDSGVLDITWDDLADVFNKNLDHEEWTSSAYRKKYQQAKSFYNEVFSKMKSDQYAQEVLEKTRELDRAKVAFRDQRNAWRKQDRDATRVFETLNMLEEDIKSSSTDAHIPHVDYEDTTNSLIVCLSDWHIGADYNSLGGVYNSDIAEERLGELLADIKYIAKLHDARHCKIAFLGDAINGNLHFTVQVGNRENFIQQLVKAGKLLSDFIIKLAPDFSDIYVCGVGGNHSRIAKKDEAIKDERMDYIPLWYTKARLDAYDNVTVNLKERDGTIAEFGVGKLKVVAVHGDWDAFTKTAMLNLAGWLGYTPDIVLSGHKHTPAMDTCIGITMVQSGSLGGSGDDYTVQKRLAGDASQSVLVCDDKGLKCLYPVKFSK